MKFTQKNNIIKKTSSKNSYAIVDHKGNEIETMLSSEDAKEKIKILNKKEETKKPDSEFVSIFHLYNK